MISDVVDNLDRYSFYLAEVIAQPATSLACFGHRLVSKIQPGKFDQLDTKIKEMGFRVLLGTGAAYLTYLVLTKFTASLFLGAAWAGAYQLIRMIGFDYQQNGFTHIRTNAKEEEIDQEITCAEHNISAYENGLNYQKGLIPFQLRADAIVEELSKKELPTVLILHGVNDCIISEELVSKLRSSYAHIYTNMGKNTRGTMIFTKAAPFDFRFLPFSSNDPQSEKGTALLEIKRKATDLAPAFRVLGTRLSPGKSTDFIQRNYRTLIEKEVLKLKDLPHFQLNSLQQLEDGLNLPIDELKKLLKKTVDELTNTLNRSNFSFLEGLRPKHFPMINYLQSFLIPSLKNPLEACQKQLFEIQNVLNGHDSLATKKRRQQFLEIVDVLKTRSDTIPTITAGTLNVERFDEESSSLRQFLELDPKNGCYNYQEATYTTKLQEEWNQNPKKSQNNQGYTDYLTSFKASSELHTAPVQISNPDLIRGFEIDPTTSQINTTNARSNRHGLRAKFSTTLQDVSE